MLKKLMYLMMASTAMLFATSCEKDVEVAPTSVVTFNVGSPELVSRAYSDGMTATVLQYAVYDENGTELTALTKKDATINGSTTVNLQLTTGNTYSVIFWAAAPNAPYTVDFATKTMTVDYSAATTVSNDENRDAFYKYHTFTVTGAQTETIELKRPFAQLNIGTSDYTAAKNAGYEPKYSSVTVKQIYTTLKMDDGTVATPVDVTFDYAAIPTTETFPVSGYEYLAMNYLLVDAEKELVDIEFGYTENDATAAKTRTVGSVPVQRNYRTNIYGKLLTSDVNINVEIKPDYDGAFDNEGYFVETGTNGNTTVIVESASGLATIAEAIAEGTIDSDVDIVLEGDIDLADLAVSTRAAVVSNWNPIGTPDEPFTGTFDGKGYTIKNLALVEQEAKEGKAYIGFFGYAKNATIKNVTFENVYINIPCLDIDHSQGHIGAVAGSLEGTSTIENVTVKGDVKVESTVTANGASRVAVVAGGNSYGNVTMKNVHVKANDGSYLKANNNVGALAGQLQGIAVFENCSSNIDVTGTKFFAGGIIGLTAGNSQFTNCHTTGDVTITAGREGRAHDHYRVGGIAGGWADNTKTPCVLEKCSYTGALSGTNADGSVAKTLDYAGFVGRGYTLAGCQGSTVIIDGVRYVQQYNDADNAGIYVVCNDTPAFVKTQKDLATKLTEGVETIILAAGEYVADLYNITDRKALNIVGSNGTKLAFDNLQVRASQFENLTISNCEIMRMPNKSWGHLVIGSSDNANGVYTISNCTFNGVGTQGIFINEMVSGVTYNIENCTFNGDFGGEGAVTIQNNDGVQHTVNVKDCTFNNIPATSHEIFVHYAYNGWTLNTDLDSSKIYWKSNL